VVLVVGATPAERPAVRKRTAKPPAPAPVGAAACKFPAPDHLDGAAAAVWLEVVGGHHEPARIIGPDLEAYCGQVATQRDARARIAREGLIVEDERGRPEPHPAIALELKAQAEIRAWGDKFRGRTPRPERGPR
jgi:phage terminase small subunit